MAFRPRPAKSGSRSIRSIFFSPIFYRFSRAGCFATPLLIPRRRAGGQASAAEIGCVARPPPCTFASRRSLPRHLFRLSVRLRGILLELHLRALLRWRSGAPGGLDPNKMGEEEVGARRIVAREFQRNCEPAEE